MHSSSIPLISAKAGAIAAGAASACTNRPDSVNAVKRLDELVSQTRKTEDRSSPNGNRVCKCQTNSINVKCVYFIIVIFYLINSTLIIIINHFRIFVYDRIVDATKIKL